MTQAGGSSPQQMMTLMNTGVFFYVKCPSDFVSGDRLLGGTVFESDIGLVRRLLLLAKCGAK